LDKAKIAGSKTFSIEKDMKKLRDEMDELGMENQRAIKEKEEEIQKAIKYQDLVSALTFDKR
jgi:hypothetical protein